MAGTEPPKLAITARTGASLAFAFTLAVLAAALPGVAVATEIQSSISRGGRLYDDWLKEIRKPPIESTHPTYPEAGRQTGSASWRCKECHGWDYKGRDGAYASGMHFTGIKGIDGMAGADRQAVISVLKDETHALVALDLLDERDFTDLANFVASGQVEMDRYIDRASGKARGDAARRRPYYQNICANCHGRDGLRIRAIPPLGKVATENPWETLHNILNGHPNAEMPPLRVLEDMQILVDVLAYIQTFPGDESLWSIARGGRLYDNWYKELKLPPPTKSHPSYPAGRVYAQAPKANWRCKECHGWDYRGRDGAYGSGRHRTGIKGIRAMADVDPGKIIAVLENDTHRYRGDLDYRASMDERDFQDLANFVASGQIDMTRHIDPESGKVMGGDPRRREAFYATVCASCHGMDGAKISTRRPLGDLARDNPWEALHNLLNGHPGVEMPPLRVLEDDQTLVDILAYIQTLSGR
ncbi:MAG: c-type cytochrome [Alphaproteobacteria bacterium]|jgi:mono/diheme cytochrome c family protein|nr:c-type cytochrome [Alphaproteobacteria bacterium]